MIALEVDEIRLERLAGEIKAMPEEVEKAFRTSLGEMASSLRTQGVRHMREILGRNIRARVIRGRWFIRVRRQDGGRIIWIGANPFPAELFLTTAQARSQIRRRRYVQVAAHTRAGHRVVSFRRRYQAGVTVRGVTHDKGLFLPGRNSGKLLAYERSGSAVDTLELPIEEAVGSAALEVFNAVPERFYERFEQQLQRHVEAR